MRPGAPRGLALRLALDTPLRLFAPVLPFVTEEVWSWWRDGSVHRAGWPDAGHIGQAAGGADTALLTTAADAIAAVRRAKSEARLSLRADVAGAVVTAPQGVLDRFELIAEDVRAAGRLGIVERAPAAAADAALEVSLRL